MFVVDKCQQRCSTYSASKQLQLCLKNGDKKLPGDSSSAIGTPSPNKPPGISFEEPAEGSQIFCVGEDDKVVAQVKSGDKDNSALSDNIKDIDDVVDIVLPDEIVDVKKK